MKATRQQVPIALFAVSFACSSPETAGQRIDVATRIEGEASARTGFENAFGWTIELSRARVAFEHLYYVTGESVGASRAWNPLVGMAHAHPGHYDAGEVLAEMGEHVVVDLLARGAELGAREGVTGSAHSGTASRHIRSSRRSSLLSNLKMGGLLFNLQTT
jgi:hypothetical protein